MLAVAIDEAVDFLKLDPADYAAEWKWDGIRVQASAHGDTRRLYSRTGDDISRSFPDVLEALDFEGATLNGSQFSLTNLSRARFGGAKLGGPVDFTSAFLLLTRIEGVDLSTATGLDQKQIDIACGDAKTKLPNGLTAPASWPCPDDPDDE